MRPKGKSDLMLVTNHAHNRIINAARGRGKKGLHTPCNLCGKTIEKMPFFSKVGGGSHRMIYYHIKCAAKVNLIEDPETTK